MIPPVRQLPNKTLHGTPRSVLVEFGLYLIGVHELVVGPLGARRSQFEQVVRERGRCGVCLPL